MKKQAQLQTLVDHRHAAVFAGLQYTSTDTPGISRRRVGKGFVYRDADGARLTDAARLSHIRALAIPPGWSSVWICPDPDGHIQAVGLDEKGRKQYRYHPKFREVRDGLKFEHMIVFADALPRLRHRVAADMAASGLGRAKVLATVVHLLETTMIRVGNEAYAKENKSYGLTTLRTRHVKIDGRELRFHFKGKSGKIWRLHVCDRRVARIVKSCQELPGQHLFQYIDEYGAPQSVTSADVNRYLKEVTGADITAKDFRTWTATVLTAMALAEGEAAGVGAQARKNVTQAIVRVSSRLGNTPTICRKCYVHPEIVTAYLDGALRLDVQPEIDGPPREDQPLFSPQEAAVLSFLRARVTGAPTDRREPVENRQGRAAPTPMSLRSDHRGQNTNPSIKAA